MRDKSHLEQVQKWAAFVRENPTAWKKIHTPFINAIFEKNREFVQRLLKTPHGKEKLIARYKIKNKEGYSWL